MLLLRHCSKLFLLSILFFFFFNDTATTEIYTLSLHDALPICVGHPCAAPAREVMELVTQTSQKPLFLRHKIAHARRKLQSRQQLAPYTAFTEYSRRSEEHTSELQSRSDLVCRLLLEKKKKREFPAALCHPQTGQVTIISEDKHPSPHKSLQSKTLDHATIITAHRAQATRSCTSLHVDVTHMHDPRSRVAQHAFSNRVVQDE